MSYSGGWVTKTKPQNVCVTTFAEPEASNGSVKFTNLFRQTRNCASPIGPCRSLAQRPIAKSGEGLMASGVSAVSNRAPYRRNTLGYGSTHRSVGHRRFTQRHDKFNTSERPRFQKHKFGSGGLPGTLFSKPLICADWVGELGVVADCYANRVVDQIDQE